MIKLYVDDVREAPEGWHLARTVTEAIRIIDTMTVSEVSLDHDIEFNEADKDGKLNRKKSFETFEPVCRYINLLNRHNQLTNKILEISNKYNLPPAKKIHVYCHSGNPFAYERYSVILGYEIVPFDCRAAYLDMLEVK